MSPASGDELWSTDAPFLILERIRTAVTMADAEIPQGHFTQFGRFLSKMDDSNAPSLF